MHLKLRRERRNVAQRWEKARPGLDYTTVNKTMFSLEGTSGLFQRCVHLHAQNHGQGWLQAKITLLLTSSVLPVTWPVRNPWSGHPVRLLSSRPFSPTTNRRTAPSNLSHSDKAEAATWIMEKAQDPAVVHLTLFCNINTLGKSNGWEHAKLIFSLLETNFKNKVISVEQLKTMVMGWGITWGITSLVVESKKWLTPYHQLKYMVPP